MDPKEKQKLMVLFGIFGVAAVLFYFNLLLKPQFARFIAMNREFHAVKTRVRNTEALIANEERIRKQHNELIERAGLLEKKLARQGELSVLLQDFSSTAESSGVKILKVKPLDVVGNFSQEGTEEDFYKQFPILIEAMAGYHECGTFINKLEYMDRFIKIDDIEIKGRAGDPRQHHIKLWVSTYIIQ